MIPPICHPGLCWLLVENYSWCALDMGVVGRLFSIFVIRSKQWLWWLFICVSVVNHKSDFKTWDQFLQHCDQGNIMLSRPIITLWFGVMVYFSTYLHFERFGITGCLRMKVDIRVIVQWGAALVSAAASALDAALASPRLWKMALEAAKGQMSQDFFLFNSLCQKYWYFHKLLTYIYNVLKQVHSILLNEWIHGWIGMQLWVCLKRTGVLL